MQYSIYCMSQSMSNQQILEGSFHSQNKEFINEDCRRMGDYTAMHVTWSCVGHPCHFNKLPMHFDL